MSTESYTRIKVEDENNGYRLYVLADLRPLNPEEYTEIFEAVRALQKVCDRFIYGAPVIRPGEAPDGLQNMIDDLNEERMK